MTAPVFVPMESAAVALGADGVAAALARAGLPVTRTGSRGLTWAEPCLEVGSGDQRRVYTGVSAGELEDVERYLSGHPSVPVEDLLAGQQRLIFSGCGADDPLSLAAYRARGGFSLEDDDPGRILDEVEASGLRGRGGAGFPAHIKWRTVRQTEADRKYIVCNADEGDSGAFADRLIMEGDPYLLIEGMLIAGMATGATQGVIYLRSEYPLAADILSRAMAGAREEGLIGPGTGFELTLCIGAGAYICGEETALLASLEGRRGEVRAKPPLPAVSGLFGRPTLVHNVITLCSLPWIARHGGEAYAGFGVGASTGTMPFQLAGNVRRGGLVELPFGVTLGELVEEWGGGTLSGRPVRAVQVGGPLGAYLAPKHFHTPMTYEAMAALGAGIGHGGIVVFDDTVNLAEQARYAFEFCAEESCGKCTPCRVGAVRGEETLRRIMAGENRFELLADLCEVMEEASLCQMGGMTPVPVRSALEHFPEDFRSD